MKIVLKKGNLYYVPIWAQRGNYIQSFFAKEFAEFLGYEEIHFTYPTDGDCHYTLLTDKKSKTGVRQFNTRVQFLDNGQVVGSALRNPNFHNYYHNQAWYSEKTPLKDVTFAQPIGVSGFNANDLTFFKPSLKQYKPSEILDITNIDSGTINVACFVHKSSESPLNLIGSGKLLHHVEDKTTEPVISLVVSLHA